jgi:hypothetical protein
MKIMYLYLYYNGVGTIAAATVGALGSVAAVATGN